MNHNLRIAPKMYKIGVTGGIASGKTKLINYLATVPRVYTINLDLYGHLVYDLNPIVLRNLRQMFGPEVVKYDWKLYSEILGNRDSGESKVRVE